MNEALQLGIIALGFPFLVVAFVSWVIHYFVALGSPPTQRAAWTSGIAYFVATALVMATAPAEYWWVGPIAAIPSALIAFWWWRADFRRDWFDETKGPPDSVELANDDWRIGLMFVGLVATILAGRVLFRLIAGS